MIDPARCRAARAILGWSQADLCAAAKIGRATLTDFEAGRRTPYERTLRDIQTALEAAGIIFIDEDATSAAGGPGVRLRKDTP
ncbi:MULTISPECIES: helix-turn-helix transcriptional regulator [unclassified Chelatococcus]|uniref:helix-turn-helix domain-containing protein n=1 Tax=unclassified Chelatococcus TaxID=2638111 RepID=UPI001BD0AAE5|nr:MULTISPECIES: helix-turn-helix transcriptional regulator [unclassified Chelatococcus]MBS7737918.1 helix-turn-helix transcriptional regulator [Chelatococcus sp. HY11]MCO5079372.1 helix-turn-helix domain-containing protein [Chelatococcus sp.]